MKFLFDLFPVILFFVAYKLGNAEQAPILLATALAIVATVLQIGWLLLRRQKVDGMLWVSLAVIVVMGGATIYFHDENFIKWKPTILYWAFALVLFVGQFGFKNNLMRKVMEAQIKLPDPVWTRLAYVWMAFFAALGALNLLMAFVVFKGDTGAWVSFKLFGFTGIFFAFVVAQGLMLSKHIEPEDA